MAKATEIRGEDVKTMRHMVAGWLVLVLTTAVWFAACSDEPAGEMSADAGAGGDVSADSATERCPFGEIEGICLPEPPRGTPPEECPSGRYIGGEYFQGEGICMCRQDVRPDQ